MSQIGDYLEQGRAGKVYDPNQGLYMDPQTGKAFVPTFTNVSNSNIQGEVEKSMGNIPVQADPYLIGGGGPGNQPGSASGPAPSAMPGRGEEPKAPDINDPWAMAQAHMKSKKFMSEIYEQMFHRPASSGFRDKAERDQFYRGLQSNRNMLVDRFKYQIEKKRKDAADKQKNARKGMSQKDALKMQAQYIAEAKGDYDEDSISFDERNQGKTAKQVGIDNYLAALELDQKLHGDQGNGGMPDREETKSGSTDVDKYSPETYDPDKATTGKRVYFQDLEDAVMMKVRSWAKDKASAANPGLSREGITQAAKKILAELTQGDVDEATGDSDEGKPVIAKKPVENVDLYSVASGA